MTATTLYLLSTLVAFILFLTLIKLKHGYVSVTDLFIGFFVSLFSALAVIVVGAGLFIEVALKYSDKIDVLVRSLKRYGDRKLF